MHLTAVDLQTSLQESYKVEGTGWYFVLYTLSSIKHEHIWRNGNVVEQKANKRSLLKTLFKNVYRPNANGSSSHGSKNKATYFRYWTLFSFLLGPIGSHKIHLGWIILIFLQLWNWNYQVKYKNISIYKWYSLWIILIFFYSSEIKGPR